MSKINTNVPSLIAQHNLSRANNDLSTSLQRLSTGLKINRGADDPAGLLVSERLRSEISGVEQSIKNAERASNVISTTESSLQEINDLLVQIKSLTIEAANTGAFSAEEIEANQLQIDSAVESITRIANTTSFAGLKLLDGSLGYITENVDTDNIADLKVNSVNFGVDDSKAVSVEVVDTAERAHMRIQDDDGSVDATGELTEDVTLEIRGPNGTETLAFETGTSLTEIRDAINNVGDALGVTAAMEGDDLDIVSNAIGSSAEISIRAIEGGDNFEAYAVDPDDTTLATSAERTTGRDLVALVNGSMVQGDGLELKPRTSELDLELTLTEDGNEAGEVHDFDVIGGGATFQIGPEINAQQMVGFGIDSLEASNLGTRELGFLSSIKSDGENALTRGNTASQARNAEGIIASSIDQVSKLRGRLGAFERNTLDTSIRSHQMALENLTASESAIRDTDFAEETSKLTRAQILQQAGLSNLSMANNTAQNVLALLQ